MTESKTVCRTPSPGKQPVRIPTWKYEAVRDAILDVLDGEEGFPFRELPEAVGNQLDPTTKKKLGSLSWHTTTVKLDLEVQGQIKRLPGKGPQLLVKI